MLEHDLTEEFTGNIRPTWHGRVPREKIRRLYENDAAGIVDAELIDDVGLALLLRCRSILKATEAHAGRAACGRCEEIIPHRWDRQEVLTCSRCGWQTTCGAYFRTYQDKQLHGGGALFAFQAFVDTYESAATPRERLLLIDQLLHAFHGELANNCTRPAACNLIGGKIGEVMELLDSLTYGAGGTPGLPEQRAVWREKAGQAPWLERALEKARARRSRERTGD
jgi:hypothetical protein